MSRSAGRVARGGPRAGGPHLRRAIRSAARGALRGDHRDDRRLRPAPADRSTAARASRTRAVHRSRPAVPSTAGSPCCAARACGGTRRSPRPRGSAPGAGSTPASTVTGSSPTRRRSTPVSVPRNDRGARSRRPGVARESATGRRTRPALSSGTTDRTPGSRVDRPAGGVVNRARFGRLGAVAVELTELG